MNDFPTIALSVRQPWAWAIIHAGKDIENRSWQAISHGFDRRGRIAIHASKGLSRDEYKNAKDFMGSIRVECPAACDLLRGGIIGSVDVTDVVDDSDSDWFFGPRGIVMRNPVPCEFIPCLGMLGYFTWTKAGADIVPKPARWMLPEPAPHFRELQQLVECEPELFK